MCRILGFYSFTNLKMDEKNFTAMRDSMHRGGPDAEGIFFDSEANLVLGHRRLSILDTTEAGNQPMHSSSGRYVISYNGEIYNFKEIRATLEKIGYSFQTNCDTEVVLAAFEEYGTGCANKFHGMFAFVIWDKKSKTLTVMRDRVGVKPVYYYRDKSCFIVASELKAITKYKNFKKVINHAAMEYYFKYGYVPCPYAIFEGCYKLLPGHYLEISAEGSSTLKKWWFPDASGYDGFDWKDEDLVIAETKKCLRQAFKMRLVSDVDVGLFLSGGIDSGLLASILSIDEGQKLQTFTIGFQDQSHNEAPAAKYLANRLGTSHSELLLDTKTAKNLIPNLYETWDEPFCDTSTISTYLVSKFASQYVKVVLSADGGDELFGGYPKYKLTDHRASVLLKYYSLLQGLQILPDKYIDQFGAFGVGNKLLKAKEIIQSSDLLNIHKNTFLIGQHIYSNHQLSNLLNRQISGVYTFPALSNNSDLEGLNDFNAMLYADFLTYHTDDIQCKVDRASMANSLEAREPYLDQEIINLAYKMPIQYKLGNSKYPGGKYILRKVFENYVDQKYLQLPKRGFGVPMDRWLSDDLSYLLDSYLSESVLKSQGLFDRRYVKDLISRFKKYPMQEVNKIWSLVSFQLWYESYM